MILAIEPEVVEDEVALVDVLWLGMGACVLATGKGRQIGWKDHVEGSGD